MYIYTNRLRPGHAQKLTKGNLGSRENILKAKSEIFAGLSEKGIAVLNGDDGLLRTLEGRIPFPIRWAGQGEDCDYRAVDIDDSFPDKLVFTAKTPRGSFPLEVPQPAASLILTGPAGVSMVSMLRSSV